MSLDDSVCCYYHFPLQKPFKDTCPFCDGELPLVSLKLHDINPLGEVQNETPEVNYHTKKGYDKNIAVNPL